MLGSLDRLASDNMLHHSLGRDNEGRALCTHILTAIHALLYPYAEGFVQLVLAVYDKAKRERMLLYKLLMTLGTVATHADDLYIRLTECRVIITQATSLSRTTRGIILGVEIEGYALRWVIRASHLLPILVNPQ